MEEEERFSGTVSRKVYVDYFLSEPRPVVPNACPGWGGSL
jgi:hypothetical protein